MTPDAFRAAITRLSFSSLGEFARWIDTNERTVRRWLDDGPPGSVAKLLQWMLATGAMPADVDGEIEAGRDS